ncbi:GNAT family N-acetyltransferase [Streptomyces sp. CB02959]|uniref:GNAT family N-acetyltransferase n=1 Tax=Streptomyces sp. CB02959 TaxID=2020330 RepID=UPI000C272F07|nr:GNAT family N-acetyltransferase [Streptomyces sp. CB02959]PJN39676.1 GNAT family N-acetyltransferase [Streptomyces sp. CB02959]
MTHDARIRHTDARVRHIAEGDWDGIAALESRAYAALGLSEEPAVLRSRAHASPATCFALAFPQRLAGYLLALPYPMFQYPDLSRAEGSTEGATERIAVPWRNLHLHDLVVAAPLRGRGLARRLLRRLTATARAGGYEQISLVAVAGSESFWGANGFAPHHGVVPPGAYGGQAVYMSRPVRAGRAEGPEPAGAASPGPAPHDDEGE